MVTYGYTAIPSDQVTVLEGGTVAISVAFENSVGLMGGMDTSSGTATEGEVVEVSSPSAAQQLFGDGSELHEQVKKAFGNGAGTVYALPVTETTTTESFSSTSSGTLGNVPFFDPNIHPEHSITVQDTTAGASVDVQVVYVDGSPSAPTASNTVKIDAITGQWTADAASSYDFTYDHGDYSTTAMQPLLDESPRIVNVLTENYTVANDLATELTSRAQDFDFMHGVVGAHPNLDPSTYSDTVDESRLSLVFPSRAYVDSAETDEDRTTGAVAGELASLALGLSSTNNTISGFAGSFAHIPTGYGPGDAGTLSDNQVMPLVNKSQGKTIAIDMTTSTTAKFERVYAMQIVDEAVEVSHIASDAFVGDQNTAANRSALARSHRDAYLEMENGTPKMLDDFTVSVTENSSNPNQVDVNIGLDVVDVIDTIDVTITVGDIVRGNEVS